MRCFKITNVRGFLFSFICLWSCGCHLLALRHVTALGGLIPAQTVYSEGAPIPTHTSTGWCYLSLPSSSSHWGPQGKHLHSGCSEVLQASGRRRRIIMKISHGPNRQGRGQDPILLANPSPLETKRNCILQKQKQQKQVSISQAASGCAHWCNAHSEQPLQQCLALWQPQARPRILEQHQPEQRCSIFPQLLPFPGHKTKQNKRHPAEKDGWIDWWFGLFCVFAFKWEGIIGGAGREKKQYLGGLVIFGAHLLGKWVKSVDSRNYEHVLKMIYAQSVLHDHWTSFSYAISTTASIGKSHNWIPVSSSLCICWGLKIPRH